MHTAPRPFLLLVLVLALVSAGPVAASPISVAGDFTSLGLDPQFDPFLYLFRVKSVSDVTIKTWGYGGGTNAAGQVIPAGGFDPIVSLFSGAGDGALFLDRNDDECPTCPDSTLAMPGRLPGYYTLALTPFQNNPWAYIDPGTYSTLGDGFNGLGALTDQNDDVRTAAFAFDITGDVEPMPEPSTLLLVGGGLLVGLRRVLRRR